MALFTHWRSPNQESIDYSSGKVHHLLSTSYSSEYWVYTLTARTGSVDPWLPAKDTQRPSTSERVLTLDVASFGSIPSLIPNKICEGQNYYLKHRHKNLQQQSQSHQPSIPHKSGSKGRRMQTDHTHAPSKERTRRTIMKDHSAYKNYKQRSCRSRGQHVSYPLLCFKFYIKIVKTYMEEQWKNLPFHHRLPTLAY